MPNVPTASRVIQVNEYRRERWRNGRGWTREIVRFPDSEAWQWRLSIAEIEQASAYSRFTGIERMQVLLEGNGLRLAFASGAQVGLEPPHGIARFDGDDEVIGAPVDGRAVAFNLMWRKTGVDADLWHRPLVGAMVVFIDPGEAWAIYLVSGQARFADASGLPSLAAGDTAVLASPDGQRTRHVIDGAGEALLVRLRPK